MLQMEIRIMLSQSIYIGLLACIVNLYVVSGDDPLQSLLYSVNCYKSTQEGCDTDLIDAYPELSMSFTNNTVADTRFYLFTKNNPDVPELLHKCAGGLPPETNFNPKCKTEILYPGGASGVCIFAIYREIKNQILKSGCYNVILVDWMWGNSFVGVIATENAKIVSKQLVIVIRKLKEKFGLKDEDFICTGHSIGAHGCGLVGKDEPIAVINGLDPAGIFYTPSTPLDERLDPSDATRCVQVTHCNGGQCIPRYLGANFTMGTKDIWFNDGLNQPGCHKQGLISFLKGDLYYALISLYPGFCNHLHCLYYYKASVCSRRQFIAVECPNAEAFQSGQCENCGRRGQNCDIAGKFSCDCNNGSYKNYYVKADIDCPYIDNKGTRTCGYSCPALKSRKKSKNN